MPEPYAIYTPLPRKSVIKNNNVCQWFFRNKKLKPLPERESEEDMMRFLFKIKRERRESEYDFSTKKLIPSFDTDEETDLSCEANVRYNRSRCKRIIAS